MVIICRVKRLQKGKSLMLSMENTCLNFRCQKRRTRSGWAAARRFLGPRVIELLSRELCIPWTKVTKRGKGTEMLISENR